MQSPPDHPLEYPSPLARQLAFPACTWVDNRIIWEQKKKTLAHHRFLNFTGELSKLLLKGVLLFEQRSAQTIALGQVGNHRNTLGQLLLELCSLV